MQIILELLQDLFEHVQIPSLFYEERKTSRKLRLDYEKIHANKILLSNNKKSMRLICLTYVGY